VALLGVPTLNHGETPPLISLESFALNVLPVYLKILQLEDHSEASITYMNSGKDSLSCLSMVRFFVRIS